jgi:tRNA (mo5U34)-methyltransferase
MVSLLQFLFHDCGSLNRDWSSCLMPPATYLHHLLSAINAISPELGRFVYQFGAQRLLHQPHGDMPRWQAALAALPDVSAMINVTADRIGLDTEEKTEPTTLAHTLLQLHPWRKGPFNFFGVPIDTEWRSDWKWQRLEPHLSSLKGRQVLDVGCGSGYHAWRMWGAGADFVLGIDPTLLYLHQFLAFKRYAFNSPVWFAPIKMEELPKGLAVFDTVFSLGVLYHRADPLAHIVELREALRGGGELVLETLVVDGDENTVLVPEDRYAAMNNVWFLPSVALLHRWLRRCGFRHIRTVDVTATTTEEQHKTDWMTFQSLEDFLDPLDNALTREGYPAPVRAMVLAEKPL